MSSGEPVGILSFNRPALTNRCLDSVLSSGREPETVFLYHNGSSKGVREHLINSYPGINHAFSETNSGYSGGFNSAMKWIFSTGKESALFLTNDTTIDPDAPDRCRKTGAETGAGFIAPAVYYLKYPGQIDSCGGYFDRERVTLSHYRKLPLPLFLKEESDYIPGTALWMNRDIFSRTGGMDERYHTYWEDADLSFRCHRSGIKMARCPDAEVYHGIGQTCHKKPLYTTFYFQRNRIFFLRRFLTGDELETALSKVEKDLDDMWEKASARSDRRKLGFIADLKKLF